MMILLDIFKKLDSVMIRNPFFAYVTDSLHDTLVRLSSNQLQEMPVISNEDSSVVGTVTISDVLRFYDKEVEKVLRTRNGRNAPPSLVSDTLSSKSMFINFVIRFGSLLKIKQSTCKYSHRMENVQF